MMLLNDLVPVMADGFGLRFFVFLFRGLRLTKVRFLGREFVLGWASTGEPFQGTEWEADRLGRFGLREAEQT